MSRQKRTERTWHVFPALLPPVALLGILATLPGNYRGTAQAQQNPPPGATEALASLQRGDLAGAAKIMEAATARDPMKARDWRVLGYISLKAKNYDRAIAAYNTALKIEPGFPQALYNVGVAYALKNDKKQAFDWLGKARATHKLDMTVIQIDPDLTTLRGDVRFDALLPKPKEFAHPFVESVKIVREWDGEAMNDQFGWIARSMGDVDGDRVNDVVTSAPTKYIGGANAGRVYLYSTRTGKLLWKADGHPGDQLGLGVECAGDTNRDGIPDVIAGAPGCGKAYIFSGKDGSVLQTLQAEDRNDTYGGHVAGVGDIDQDGYADVMVGASTNNAGGHSAGRAYVYSGKDGHLLLTLTGERAEDGFGSTVAGYSDGQHRFLIVGAPGAGPKHTGRTYVYDALSQTPKFVIDADETGSALGYMFVSVVGDVDGDGVPDIYASDFGNSAKGPATGRVYIRSGKDGHSILTLTGETPGEGFGIGRADAGDVDHDGHADLIIGSWQYGGAAVSGGRATLYSGKSGRVLKTYTCRVPGDTFGFDAVGIGDVDGDGSADLLITSAWSGIHGYHSGRMFIVSSGIRAAKH